MWNKNTLAWGARKTMIHARTRLIARGNYLGTFESQIKNKFDKYFSRNRAKYVGNRSTQVIGITQKIITEKEVTLSDFML